MNRCRILSGIHTTSAREAHEAKTPPASVDHSTIERMSIADLDRIAPHLIPSPPPDADEDGDAMKGEP